MRSNPATNHDDLTEVEAYTVRGFERAVRIGHTKTYEEIRAGRLEARKCGRRTIITRDAARRWLAGLPQVKATERPSTAA